METIANKRDYRRTSPSDSRSEELQGILEDPSLSTGPRMLLTCYVLGNAKRDGSVTLDTDRIAKLMGIDEEYVAQWVDELISAGYLKRAGGESNAYVLCRQPDSSLQASFDEILLTVPFPRSLQDYYESIYCALKDYAADLVLRCGSHVLEKALKIVSSAMENGSVDERGPEGLVLYWLRKLGSAPRRDFGDEEDTDAA
jgi:hypothetical protein